MNKHIAIIGYGYVGSGMGQLFKTHPLTVYDPPKGWEGQALKDRVNGCDLAIICVPTPASKDGSADISLVDEAVSWIEAPLILIKSTVPPGTTDMLRGKYGKDVHFSPEYMGEPKNFVPAWKYPDPRDPTSHPFVIVGGPRAPDVLEFFQRVMATNARYIACEAVEAELAKYMENAYYAMKVSFCNEFANIAAAFGVSYAKLRELWLADPRVDPDHTLVFKDARGFGGKCLPKDLSAIITAAHCRGQVTPLLSALEEYNTWVRR